MKKQFLNIFILALIAGIFIYTPVFSANTDIVINEIGASPTSTHEWIEIWNKGTDSVDLTGWKFWEASTNHGLTATSSDSIVAPGEFAAICQNSTSFLIDHPSFGGSIFSSSWSSLSTAGEEIGLKDSAGIFIEQFTYLAMSSHSLERKNPTLADYTSSNWAEHATGDTLGAQNSNYSITIATTTTSTETTSPSSTPSTSSLWAQLKINEFLPDPDSGEEWIELYNPTTSSLDLADGTLCDSRTTSCTIFSLTGTIAGSSWATFFLTSSHLNNDGDSVILKNPDGAVVDQIIYGTTGLSAPEKGQSIARKIDGADIDTETDWTITTSLTPGAANTIVEPPAPVSANISTGGGGGGSSGGSVVVPSTSASTVAATTTAKTTTTAAKTSTPPPIGLIWKIVAPRAAAPLEDVTFSAVGTVDPRGGAVLMSWNFSDGIALDGQTVTRSFVATGTIRVTVLATSTQKTIDRRVFAITIAPGNSARQNGIAISEVFPNPPGADQDEFIELTNGGATSTAISGWKLETNSGKTFTIPENTVIRPNESLVFYRAATRLVLNNANETIFLKTPEDVTMYTVTFEKSVPSKSLSLVNGQFGWTADTTPGFLGAVEGVVLGEKIVAPVKIASSQSSPFVAPKIVGRALSDTRILKKGTPATVTGIVSVPTGNFSTHYFYISDSSGGLQIYSSRSGLPMVAVGDKIVVSGVMSGAYGAPRLNILPTAVDVLATNQTIAPESLVLGDIDENAGGKLVTVTGEITDIKGNQLYLDDGDTEAVAFLKTAAHIDRSRLKSGDNVQITGVVEQTTNGWQILPRGSADILVVAPATGSTALDAPSARASSSQKYAVTTLAGGSIVGLAALLRFLLHKP